MKVFILLITPLYAVFYSDYSTIRSTPTSEISHVMLQETRKHTYKTERELIEAYDRLDENEKLSALIFEATDIKIFPKPLKRHQRYYIKRHTEADDIKKALDESGLREILKKR